MVMNCPCDKDDRRRTRSVAPSVPVYSVNNCSTASQIVFLVSPTNIISHSSTARRTTLSPAAAT